MSSGNFPYRISYPDLDRQRAETIQSYWTNFARSGDPNGGPDWPHGRFTIRSKTMSSSWGDTIAVRLEINSQGLDFFDDFYRSLRPSPAVQ